MQSLSFFRFFSKPAALGVVFCIFSLLGIDNIVSAKKNGVNAQEGSYCPFFLVTDGDDPGGALDQVPTTLVEGECRLDQDVVGLARTFRLKSGITLNCQDHTITPEAPGTEGVSASRSTPELAIYMKNVDRSQVKNCKINDFDHAIFAAGSKIPPGLRGDPAALADRRNVISNNEIRARFVAVHLVSSDNFDIEGNTITWKTRGGVGIFIQHDSDLNEVKGNTVTGDFLASTQGAVLFPGLTATGIPPGPGSPTQPALNSNPVFPSAHAPIVVVKVLGPHSHLFNAIIDGELLQFKDADVLLPDAQFPEDNLVEDNDIFFKKPNTSEDGILASNSVRTTVRANHIGRAPLDPAGPDGGRRASIRAGGIKPLAPARGRIFPGNCSLNPARLCLSAFDCNIPGIDAADQGPCDNTYQIYSTSYPVDFTVEDNIMFGPMQFGVGVSGSHPTIKNNKITGPVLPTATQPYGGMILEGKFTLESAIVMENTVDKCEPAMAFVELFLSDPDLGPEIFGAQISHNNFTDYSTAIRTWRTQAGGYFVTPGEISVAGVGNYWDLTCEEGVNGFDPHTVLQSDGTENPDIVDSHPLDGPFDPEDVPGTCS